MERQDLNAPPTDEVDGAYFVQVPIRRWRWVVGAVILGLVCGFVYAKVAHRSFTATATTVVNPVPTGISATRITEAPVNTLNEQAVASSHSVALLAGRLMHSQETPSKLVKKLSVTPVAKSGILTFSFKGGSQASAAAGANAFATAYLDQRRSSAEAWVTRTRQGLQARLAAVNRQLATAEARVQASANHHEPSGAQASATQFANEATAIDASIGSLDSLTVSPGDVTQPADTGGAHAFSRKLEVGVGGLAGLLVGLIAAFVWERLDDRIRPRGAHARQLGLAPMAVVGGRHYLRAREEVAVVTKPGSGVAGSYARLAARLIGRRGAPARGVLVFASPAEQEAALTVAANVAAAISRTGLTVSLVCVGSGCAARPRFDLGKGAGRHSRSSKPADGDGVRPLPRLQVFDLGGSDDPAGLRRELTRLTGDADYTVVVAPALLGSDDGLLVASWADEVVVVAAAGRDRASATTESVGQLESMGVLVLGVVVQGAAPRRTGSAGPGVGRRTLPEPVRAPVEPVVPTLEPQPSPSRP